MIFGKLDIWKVWHISELVYTQCDIVVWEFFQCSDH